MEYFEMQLTGDPARAKATVQDALEARKFKVRWTDEWAGSAERGNKVANVLAGALAQYFLVEVAIGSIPESTASLVRVSRGSRGYMGGAIGVSRTNKNMRTLFDELQATFSAAGVLQSATAAPK